MTTTVDIGIEKKTKGEKDKTKAKFKNKTKGNNKNDITVEDNGDITINVTSTLELSFELDDDNWSNYHFANSPDSNPPKVSFVASADTGDTASEFTVDTPAPNQTSRTMTVKDLNSDGKTWTYTVTLFLNSNKTPSNDLPAELPLDPVIRNKNLH